MVAYAQQAGQLYTRLQKMEAHAEKKAGDSHPPLQFHNFVNGATSIIMWDSCAEVSRQTIPVGCPWHVLQHCTSYTFRD